VWIATTLEVRTTPKRLMRAVTGRSSAARRIEAAGPSGAGGRGPIVEAR
jgi:hypothetical protein